MKRRQKALSLLLTLCLTLGLLPWSVPAQAAASWNGLYVVKRTVTLSAATPESGGELWVGGTQVNTGTAVPDVLRDGTVSFDPNGTDGPTLTLDGASITAGHLFSDDALGGTKQGCAAIYSTLPKLTIVVKNYVVVNCFADNNLPYYSIANDVSWAGIYCKGSLNIQGGGSNDTLVSHGGMTDYGNAYGIYAGGSMMIDINNLEASGPDSMVTRGIEAGDVMIAEGTTVGAMAGESGNASSLGLLSTGLLTVNGMLLAFSRGSAGTAYAGDSCGVACGKLSIGPMGTVTSEGGKTTNADAVSAGIWIGQASEVSGNTLTALGGNDAAGLSCGVYCNSDAITISCHQADVYGGTNAGGPSCGVYCEGGSAVTVSGGTVTLTGGSCGIYVKMGAALTISGGTVTVTDNKPLLSCGIRAERGSVLLLAQYENGALTALQSKKLTQDVVNATPASLGLTLPTAGTWKLLLVDGTTFAPLCAATSVNGL